MLVVVFYHRLTLELLNLEGYTFVVVHARGQPKIFV
jgi:hypothetical protein